MESGLIFSIATVFVSFITTFVTVKISVEQNKRDIEKVIVEMNRIVLKLDQHSEMITQLNTQQQGAITSEKVADLYVSKELFRQFEKHIDNRFDGVDRTMGNILDAVNDLKKGVEKLR